MGKHNQCGPRLPATLALLIAFLTALTPAFASVNFNLKNNSQSFFYVNGSSGNVGIGTSAAQIGLAVTNGNMGIGTWTAPDKLLINGSVDIGSSNASSSILTTTVSNGNLTVQGNVGFGTSQPAAALDVKKEIDLFRQNAIYYPSSDTTAGGSIGIGVSAMSGQTSSAAYGNTAIGYQAINQAMSTSAVKNTFIGWLDGGPSSSAQITSVGSFQYAIGGYDHPNTVNIGEDSGVGGSNATSMGQSTIAGTDDVAIGEQAISGNSNGNNVAFGYYTGSLMSPGNGQYNIFLGTSPTRRGTITSGKNNIEMGYDLGKLTATANNQLDIGNLLYAIGIGSENIVSTGNVGIMTSAPSNVLDIVGNVGIGTVSYSNFVGKTAGKGNMILEGPAGIGTTTPQDQLDVLNGNVGIGTWSAAGGNLIVNGGGNVGIGSAWPGNPLDVQGSLRAAGFVGDGSQLTGISAGGWSHAAGSTYTATGSNNVGIGTTTAQIGLAVTNGNMGIGTWTSPDKLLINGSVDIGSSNASSSILTTNVPKGSLIVQGNVGIGTWQPAAALDVRGNVDLFRVNGIFYPQNDTTASGTIIIGSGALPNFKNLGSRAYATTAVGYQVMARNQAATTNIDNTEIGNNAGYDIVYYAASSLNTSVGFDAGYADQGSCTDIGSTNEIYSNGLNNVSIGFQVLYGSGSPTANNNTAIGASSLRSITGVGNTANTALGFQSGYDLSTGTGNTFLGSFTTTGVGITTGENNILMGYNVRPKSQTANGQFNIGNLIYAIGIGTQNIASKGNVGIGTSAPSNVLDIVGNVGIGTISYSNFVGNAAGKGNLILEGGVGIATTAPQDQLDILGNVGIGTWSVAGGNLIVNGGGNVGIGSAWPGNPLDVQGSLRAAGFVGDGSQIGLTAGGWSHVIGSTYTATGSNNVGIGTSTAQIGLAVTNGNTGIGTWTAPDKLLINGSVDIGSSNTSSSILTTNVRKGSLIVQGNVGFGTSQPAAALDVKGTIGLFRQNAISYPSSDTTAGGSIGLGASALSSQTSSAAYGNTAIGYGDLNQAMTTSAIENTFIGCFDGGPTTGSQIIVVGSGPPPQGVYNYSNSIFVGQFAMNQGNNAVSVGSANTCNLDDIGIGYDIFCSSSSGNNTAFGRGEGCGSAVGPYNILLGSETSNQAITSGKNNIVMGYNLGKPVPTANNQLDIGNLVYAIGIGSENTASTGNVGIGTLAPSNVLDVVGNVGIGTVSYSNFVGTSSGKGNLILEGGMGIGTTTPQDQLDVLNGNVGIGTWTAAGGNLIVTPGSRNVGIGTAWPGMLLDVFGNVRLDNAGNLTVSGLTGCGGIQTSANGLMSCTSDEGLKDIHGNFNKGLAALDQIHPKTYSWKKNSYLNDDGRLYSGFIAQDVAAAIPEAVNTGTRGYKQVSTTPILAAAINALRELQDELAEAKSENQSLWIRYKQLLQNPSSS